MNSNDDKKSLDKDLFKLEKIEIESIHADKHWNPHFNLRFPNFP